MGALRTTLSCAGAAVAVALTPVAGGTFAEEGDRAVAVAPTAPRPGDDVRVTVDGCDGRTGTAASDAFVAEARLTGTGADGRLSGETRVRSGARPGPYPVRVRCDGVPERRTAVTVAGARAEAEAEADAAAPGVAQTVTGLVLAGVAAAVVVLVPRTARRRRARQR
jgi:hypothetical protein